MGRSSAGGGGGGHSSSGGSFHSSSGHRSSGAGRSSRGMGSSGGGFSGNGGFGGPGGGFRGGFGGFGGPRMRPRGYGGYGYGWGGGSFFMMFVTVVIVLILASFLVRLTDGSGSRATNSIQVSTVDREKLSDSLTKETAYYQDDLGWIGNSAKLEKGLKYFYQTTGVFPYLWITDNIDGDRWPSDDTIDAKLEEMYTNLFQDEGHSIILYLDAGNGEYITRCLRGASAKTVLDSEATEILLDYLDAYATSDLDDETYFATCFTKAADRMMNRTTTTKDVVKTVVVAVAVVAVVIILVIFFLKRRKMKLEQAKIDEEILNSKL